MADFFKSKVLANKKLNYKFHHVKLQLLDKPFTFLPGQFVTLKVGEGIYRSYSVASLPNQTPLWELIVDITPGGPGTTYISNLKPGDIIESTAPKGVFTLRNNESNVAVLMATGCGIASIKPMAEELLKNQKAGKVFLLWGLRFEEDVFLQDLLNNLRNTYQNFEYEIVLSKPGKEWSGKIGHVTNHLHDLLQQHEFSRVSVYLCGNGEMIKDVLKSCDEMNFPCDRIYFERYS